MKKRKNKKIKKNMKYLLTFYVSFYIISLALRNYLEAITKEKERIDKLIDMEIEKKVRKVNDRKS